MNKEKIMSGENLPVMDVNRPRCINGKSVPETAKPKVLFVIDTLETGGAEQSLLDNLTRFTRSTAVVCHLYAGDTLRRQFVNNGIPVYSIGLQRKYGFRQAYRQLKNVVQAEQPDLLVACLTRSELVTRAVGRILRIPVIGTFVSDLYSPVYNQRLSRRARMAVAFFRLLNKATGRFCKGFIANSETIKKANALQLGIPLQKIEVINRGRDSKVFTFQPPSLLAGKPLRFLNTGRLVPVKGQRELVLAFSVFLEQFPGAVLHIAGEGPCRKELTQLIKETGLENSVVLLGARSDLPRLIHDYDCFVFPSRSEGFSGSVVEAMLAGLPVLAGDIPVNREMITHLHTGYLFSAGPVQSIVDALLWFAGNRTAAAVMAQEAHRHALQHYELEKIAARLENYLHQMIRKQ